MKYNLLLMEISIKFGLSCKHQLKKRDFLFIEKASWPKVESSEINKEDLSLII